MKPNSKLSQPQNNIWWGKSSQLGRAHPTLDGDAIVGLDQDRGRPVVATPIVVVEILLRWKAGTAVVLRLLLMGVSLLLWRLRLLQVHDWVLLAVNHPEMRVILHSKEVLQVGAMRRQKVQFQ